LAFIVVALFAAIKAVAFEDTKHIATGRSRSSDLGRRARRRRRRRRQPPGADSSGFDFIALGEWFGTMFQAVGAVSLFAAALGIARACCHVSTRRYLPTRSSSVATGE
jgi:hypothetical protein